MGHLLVYLFEYPFYLLKIGVNERNRGQPWFTPPKSPICVLGKRICSKTGIPLRHLWWILVYTAKREMSEEKRVSPMIFLTWNAVGAGVWKSFRDRVAPFWSRVGIRPGTPLFSHGLSFLKPNSRYKQVNKYITTSLYT